jgi:hypothetical protein
MLAERSMRLLNVRSGISGRFARDSITTNEAIRASDRAPRPSVRAEPQPALLASTTA